MKRIDSHIVETTDIESRASIYFEYRLDVGDGIHQAIDRVREVFALYDLDEDFYRWLGGP